MNSAKNAAISTEKEANEWPQKVLEQKMLLKERLDTVTEDAKLFDEKGLERSSYELKKQALLTLETLVQNSEGEEKESFQKRIEELQNSVARFEEEADQNRVTEAIASLSSAELKAQEKGRREAFFNGDYTLEPTIFLQNMYP